MIKVMAIDPGLTFGWVVVDRKDITRFSTDPSEIKKYGCYGEHNTNEEFHWRLGAIKIALFGTLGDINPDIILLEELNLTFDRKHKNREALQKYSAAWGMLYATIHQWLVSKVRKGIKLAELHIIPIPKPNPRGKTGGRKKMIMKTVELNYKITGITDHEAEAIWWAMNYERRGDG